MPKKISADSNLASPDAGDLIPIVDVSEADAEANKTITYSQLATAAQGALADSALQSSNLASQAQAEAGLNNTTWVSPLRVAQAIEALSTGAFAVAASTEITPSTPIVLAAASGNEYGFDLSMTVNQSGTAGYDVDYANVTETATGSGSKYLLRRAVGGVDKFSVDNAGNLATGGATPSSGDVVHKLGDNAGVNKLSVQDSDGVEAGSWDSNGKMTIANVAPYVSGVYFAAAPTARIWGSLNHVTGIHLQGGTGEIWSVTGSDGHARRSCLSNNVVSFASGFSREEAGKTIGFAAASDSDYTPLGLTLQGWSAYASATTNLIGGDVNVTGGAGASGSAGLATGGDVNISGGTGYGTGVNGKVNLAGITNISTTYTVATLPTGAAGDVARITDGDAALAWGATAVNSGSGATAYLVWYNGTNWVILGTDAITPATESFVISCGAFETDSVADTGVGRMPMPYDFTLSAVILELAVAATGSTYTVDINKNGVSVLSTKLTIDAGETSSRTATVAAVISVPDFLAGDIVTIDIDSVGATIAGQEPMVTLIGEQA